MPADQPADPREVRHIRSRVLVPLTLVICLLTTAFILKALHNQRQRADDDKLLAYRCAVPARMEGRAGERKVITS